jgi:hypothetical protein
MIIDRGKLKYLEKKPVLLPLFHHRSYMDCPGIKPGPS